MLNESVRNLVVQNCVFRLNLAEAGGGAICNVDSTVYVRRCQFWFNEVRREDTDPPNEPRYYGGADAIIVNCTFSSGYADHGLMLYDDPSDGGEIELRNSILWAGTETYDTIRRIDPADFDNVSYSDVELLHEQPSYSGPGNLDQNLKFYHTAYPAAPLSWESFRIPVFGLCCDAVPAGDAPLLDFTGSIRNGGGISNGMDLGTLQVAVIFRCDWPVLRTDRAGLGPTDNLLTTFDDGEYAKAGAPGAGIGE